MQSQGFGTPFCVFCISCSGITRPFGLTQGGGGRFLLRLYQNMCSLTIECVLLASLRAVVVGFSYAYTRSLFCVYSFCLSLASPRAVAVGLFLLIPGLFLRIPGLFLLIPRLFLLIPGLFLLILGLLCAYSRGHACERGCAEEKETGRREGGGQRRGSRFLQL